MTGSEDNEIEMIEDVQKDSSMALSRTLPIYNLNSMTKSIQVFKGAADDHFETFEENTRLFLYTQYPYAPENQAIYAGLISASVFELSQN